MKYAFISIAVCSLLAAQTAAQSENSFKFTQISVKDGLAQNTVRAILVDKTGFVWAGTLAGINRYDGYKFQLYQPQSMPANRSFDCRVRDIFEDTNGFIWVKYYDSHFYCYNPRTDSFVHFFPEDENIGFNNFHLMKNGDIVLWDGNDNQVLKLHFNGEKFESKLFNLSEQTQLQNKFLYEDSHANVWIGGSAGLVKITADNHQQLFAQLQYAFNNALEINDLIYFSTTNSLLFDYNPKSNVFSENKNPLVMDEILSLAKMDDEKILFSTRRSGIFTYNIVKKQFCRPNISSVPDFEGRQLFIADKNGGIWIYNHTGIVWYYNQQRATFKKMMLIPPEIMKTIDYERYNVFIDSNNLIWITTYGNGLFTYNPQTEELVNFKYNETANSLPSDYLLSIAEDKFGNIWVGCEYAGIAKIVRNQQNTHTIYPESAGDIGKNNNIRSLFRDSQNNIWVGTRNGGLFFYDYLFSERTTIYTNANAYTFAEDSAKNIWIGCKVNGIYRIDGKTLKQTHHFLNISGDSTSLANNTVFSILCDSKNRMWIGTFGSGLNLAQITPQGIFFRRFTFSGVNQDYIRCIFQDSTGKIWLGTTGGLISFDAEQLIENPKNYQTNPLTQKTADGSTSYNYNDVKTIFEDIDHNLWIGTAGAGLLKFSLRETPETRKIEHFTTENGLSSNFITAILEDTKGNLWFSSESGINKYDKLSHSFIAYRFSDGTYENYFNENAAVFTYNGYMLWGSLNGILTFNPDDLVTRANETPIIFSNFYLFNQLVTVGEKNSPLKTSITFSHSIELKYNQNAFTIEFSSLDLKNPKDNKYVFKLENFDRDWSAVSNSNRASYKNLPSGKYIFKVRGINRDGVWNEKIASINILIAPPFYLTWYAYLIYFLLLLALLFLAWRLVTRFNELNSNIRVEKELTNYKLRFFTNISHEFRTPLTLILGAVETLKAQKIPSETVNQQINVLSRNSINLNRLIEQLLEFRKLQNNVLKLDLEATDMVVFARNIFGNFEEMAVQKNIKYVFESEKEHFPIYIDRRKMDKILYNLLSNAFKYTVNNGEITLALHFNEQTKICWITVADNGMGIPKDKQDLLFSRFMQINFSQQGTGVGLSLVKEFVDVHKGKIWYEENYPKGSIFNLEFSLARDTYAGENFVSDTVQDPANDENAENNQLVLPDEIAADIPLPEIEDAVLSNYKMLIIDDNDDIRNFLTDEFSKYFMVENAENGSAGLEKAIDINPDLIVCDVMMPEMDGFELTRRLKENFETCHIPIIMLTAHSLQEHRLEGVQAGADAYITKPFSIRLLVARVFKLIEQRELLKKRFSSEYVLDGNLIGADEKDRNFLKNIEKILNENLTDPAFSVEKFAELTRQRRTFFYKKVRGITGLSPNELLKSKRLKKAAELLISGNSYTVSEVAYKVGFEDPFYFSKCFKQQFGVSPSRYGQNEKEKK